MFTNWEPSYYAGGDLTMTITQPGPVSFPLSQFQTIPGFSFADVDFVQIHVGECPADFCEPPAVARAHTIGPVRMVAGVVSNRAQTWGRLKALYR